MENIKNIIESLLFVADEPLTLDRLKKILIESETGVIRNAIGELAAEYEARPGGFYLDEVAGGYQIRTRPEYNEWIKKLIQPKPLRLSKPALETLVIIAYKQPIIRSDIEHLRGVDCGGVIRVLLERKLIRVLGRREIAGRPLIYATTKRFLEIFDLKNLRDLPTPKEIGELAASANEGQPAVIIESTHESEDQPSDAEVPETNEEETHEIPEPAVQSSEIDIPAENLETTETQKEENPIELNQETKDQLPDVRDPETTSENVKEILETQIQSSEIDITRDTWRPAEAQPEEDSPAEAQAEEAPPVEIQSEEDSPEQNSEKSS